MKLIIEKELRYIDENIKENNNSYVLYNDFFNEMKKYGITYKEEFNSDGLNIIIVQQKICLDEYQMNKFFYDVLSYFDYELRNDYDSYDKKTFCLVVRPKQVGN